MTTLSTTDQCIQRVKNEFENVPAGDAGAWRQAERWFGSHSWMVPWEEMGAVRRWIAALKAQKGVVWMTVGKPASICYTEWYRSVEEGGPGYWFRARLHASRKGTGQLLAEVDGWENERSDRFDDLRQIAADLGYTVEVDNSPMERPWLNRESKKPSG
jgi:hypothetical protein